MPLSSRVGCVGRKMHRSVALPPRCPTVARATMQTLRIGLFGLKRAGKTVISSVLYHQETGDGLELTVRDDGTIRYLRPLAESLERGDVPVATHGPPTLLKWTAAVGETRYQLETTDFPGELLDVIGQDGDPVGEAVMAKFRKEVRDWFVQCDAVLLVIDATDRGTVRYRDALVGLLDEMARRPTLRGCTRRAVGVVFSKADAAFGERTPLHDPGAVEAALREHPLYEVVHRRLREARDGVRTRVFASTALGWHFVAVGDARKADRRVRPQNLFAPVRWAIEQGAELVGEAHRQILDELSTVVQEKASEDRVWPFVNYKAMTRAMEEADQQFGLSSGPAAARFAALRQRLEADRTRRRRAAAAVGVAVAMGWLALSYGYVQQSRLEMYDEYDRLLDAKFEEAGVRERLAFFKEHIATRGSDWFWRTADRRQAAEDRNATDQRVFARVLATEAFEEWKKHDAADRAAGFDARRHAAAAAYLVKYGQDGPPECLAAVREVARRTKEAHDADVREWEAVANAPADDPARCEQKVARLRAYADRPGSLKPDDARAAAGETLKRWDRVEYESLFDMARQARAPFQELEAAAAGYVRPSRHPSTMADAVRPLIEQIAGMRKGKSYYVLVKTVSIPDGSNLHAETWGYPNCSVTVGVGPQSHTTTKVKPPAMDRDRGFTIEFNQRLGPFDIGFGPVAAVVKVTTHRTVFGDSWAALGFESDTWVMPELDKAVAPTCRSGKQVKVVLECPDARLPALPPFRN